MEKDIMKTIEKIDNEVENETLSEQQMREVQEYLKENEGPETKLMNKIIEEHKDEDNSSFPLEEGQASIKIDSRTGLGTIVPEEAKIESELALGDIDENVMENLSEEQLSKSIKDSFDMSDEDVLQLLKVIDRYKKKEKFNVYNAMPESMKEKILSIIGISKEESYKAREQLNLCAKLLVDEFISNAQMDQLFVDFDNALANELNIPSLTDMYSDFLREQIEVDLVKKAGELEKTNPKAAENTRAFIEGFKESYQLTDLINLSKTPGRIRTKLYRDLKMYDKIVRGYRTKASRSKFKFYDVDDLIGILCRVCNTTEDTAKRFIILFCNSIKNEDLDNDMKMAVYTYYFSRNIKALEFIDEDKKSDFTETLITNIKTVLSEIDSFIACHSIELSSKKGGGKNAKRH